MSLPDGVVPSHEPILIETLGLWRTEAESAAAFDAAIAPSGLFRTYSEVPGELLQPRAGQVERTVRIDRVLVPSPEALLRGWSLGAIGVELKRSGEKVGPPLAQAMDYLRSAWRVRGVLIHLDAVFLWPMAKQHGAIASLMAHNRIGAAEPARKGVRFYIGEECALRIEADFHTGEVAATIGIVRSGTKVGSR